MYISDLAHSSNLLAKLNNLIDSCIHVPLFKCVLNYYFRVYTAKTQFISGCIDGGGK